jgi:tetratricopeptide (TPR) repeat protein
MHWKPSLVFLLAGLGPFSLLAQTKPQSPADLSKEAAVVEHFNVRVHFENDGTGFRETSMVVRLQSQAGVESFGQLVFGYSSATEKLEVNYVRVRKSSGETVETPAANTQDFAPEVLRSAPMYSDYRQKHVTVAGLRPGDLLEYQTTTRIATALTPGEFWFEHRFPKGMAITEARLDIEVPKAREPRLKSPNREYTTVDTGEVRTYTWVVQNVTPHRRDSRPNQDDEDEDADEIPDVQMTTFKDWRQVALWYAKLQGERVVVDDAIQKKAADLTRGATTQQEKARRLYDFVARDIRYVSLSFGIGRFQPHFAAEVLQGSYGDCKDKHTLLSALLKAAGIQSYPVLIGSERKLDEEIPSPAQFDHVITVARIDKDKDLVWLDATAEVAPYGLILYPLRDKEAVVASDDANGGLRRTPALSPVKNSLTYTMDGRLSDSGALDATIDLSAAGDSAVLFRIAFRSTAQADWQRLAETLSWIDGLPGKVGDLDVESLEDTAKPFHLRYKYHRDSYFPVPSTGSPFLPFPPLRFAALPKKKSNEPLDIGPVGEVRYKVHLRFANNYTFALPPTVRLSRDYVEYSSVFQLAGSVLEGERTLAVKISHLPATRRPDVESLRSVAADAVGQSLACTIRPASKTSAVTALPEGAKPEELRKAALKALEERDFQTASELLKRVVEHEPASTDAWDDLGRAYAGLGRHNEATAAFQKQVAANAFHKRAYNDLGAELRQQGKYEEALAAYAKQLGNNPVDHTASRNHALLLLQLKKQKEALAELEALTAAPPEDPELELALAQLYASTGNTAKSHDLPVKVIGSASPVPNGDVYAVALRDDINADDTLNTASKILLDIGDQFDEGAFEEDSPETFSTMQFVALEWARTGWAKSLKGETPEAIRYLNAAWNLGQSGTVANRLGRVYQKAGQTANAKRLLALAIAAGGSETENSRALLLKLGGNADAKSAQTELSNFSTVKVPALTGKKGEAEFTLVFDGSSKPDRAEYRSGDDSLRSAGPALMEVTYPVTFPDRSSIKIVRRGLLSCGPAGCSVMLRPLDSVQPMPFAGLPASRS